MWSTAPDRAGPCPARLVIVRDVYYFSANRYGFKAALAPTLDMLIASLPFSRVVTGMCQYDLSPRSVILRFFLFWCSQEKGTAKASSRSMQDKMRKLSLPSAKKSSHFGWYAYQ
jgi:hypothetical protein